MINISWSLLGFYYFYILYIFLVIPRDQERALSLSKIHLRVTWAMLIDCFLQQNTDVP